MTRPKHHKLSGCYFDEIINWLLFNNISVEIEMTKKAQLDVSEAKLFWCQVL